YCSMRLYCRSFFFFQAEDGIRDRTVTGVQTCALPIYTFVVGTALADNGRTLYATAAGDMLSEDQLVAGMTGDDDPNFRTVSVGDRWRSDSTVEPISGIFQVVQLTGGHSNNTIVVNDSDNTIYIGGIARRVTPFNGRAILDNRGNDNP